MRDEDFDQVRDRNRMVLEASKHLFQQARELARVSKAARARAQATVAKAHAMIDLCGVPGLTPKPESA